MFKFENDEFTTLHLLNKNRQKTMHIIRVRNDASFWNKSFNAKHEGLLNNIKET